jgi:uncharacterized damage-inducible protein DinB
MVHPLVEQVRFARMELQRGLEGLPSDDARRRILPMNSISWMICHLANHERRVWLVIAQGVEDVAPDLPKLVQRIDPDNTPTLDEAWGAWRAVTATVDPYFDTLTDEILAGHFERHGTPLPESVGTMLQRMLYHYWYHIGEAMAARQLLGHMNLPEFVGPIGDHAPFRPH